MLTIHPLPLGILRTNCYILQGDTDRCLVIDPADDAGAILSFTKGLGLTVEAILLTHGHFDHVGAVRPLAAATGCRVFLCEADCAMPRGMTAGELYHTDTYTEGDRLTLAGLSFTVLHTPGHTPGSVCLCFGEDMFCGDTLFAGGHGRTDLPCGDPVLMRSTLDRLFRLETNYRLWPGHGESTTLAGERWYHPNMR